MRSSTHTLTPRSEASDTSHRGNFHAPFVDERTARDLRAAREEDWASELLIGARRCAESVRTFSARRNSRGRTRKREGLPPRWMTRVAVLLALVPWLYWVIFVAVFLATSEPT